MSANHNYPSNSHSSKNNKTTDLLEELWGSIFNLC